MTNRILDGIYCRDLHAHLDSCAWRELFRFQREQLDAPFVALQTTVGQYFIEQARGQPRYGTLIADGALMGFYSRVKSTPTHGGIAAYTPHSSTTKPSSLLLGLLSRMYDQEA